MGVMTGAIQAEDVTRKWVNENLQVEDIEQYLNAQRDVAGWDNRYETTDDVIKHVSQCFYSLYQSDVRGRTAGGFVKALKTNNFAEVCGLADSTNQQFLWIYGLLLHNCVPVETIQKWRSD